MTERSAAIAVPGMDGRGAAARGRGAWLLAGVAGAAALGVLLAWAAAHAAGEPACALRRLAGLECATCGVTRALAHLARGDWAGALAAHPWVPLALAQLGIGWGAWGLWLSGRLARRPDRWIPHVALANLAALTAWWALRLGLGGPAT